MNELQLRKAIRAQAKEKLVLEAQIQFCDFILEQHRINELDIGSILGSGADFLGDNLGASFTRSIKQYLVELLFARLVEAGLPITQTSIFGRIIVNIITQLKWSELSAYFSGSQKCAELADAIVAGIQEGFAEFGIDELTAAMFGVPGRRLQGILGSPLRELINISLENMTEEMRAPLTAFFCDHQDLDKLVKQFKKERLVTPDGKDLKGEPVFKLKRKN